MKKLNKEIINCNTYTIMKRLKTVNSNKLDSDQSLIFFAGVIYSIILNRSIYKKNADLEPFVKKYILSPLNKEQFKRYVYLSRTLLGSRVYRIIIEDFSYSLVTEVSQKLLLLFEKSDSQNKNKVKINNIASELSGWLKND